MNKKRYWLRGLLISVSIGVSSPLVFLAMFIKCFHFFSPRPSHWYCSAYIFDNFLYILYWLFGAINTINPNDYIIVYFVITLIIFSLPGALIGWLYGKLKHT